MKITDCGFTMMSLMGQLILIGSLISCVSTTTIQAVNSKGDVMKDVKVYVDGQYLGQGAVTYSDKKTVYSAVPFMELKKEGCKTHREKLNTKTNWVTSLFGAVFTGVGLGIMAAVDAIGPESALLYGTPIAIAGLIPLFWTRSYVPFQKLEFQCLKTTEE